LEQGLPGSSFAFEIAQRVGIPDNLLRKARERTGNERAQSESLLQNLKQQLQDTEKDRRKLAKLIETNEETERKLKHAEREIRERKDAVLKKAREAAHRLLVDAQKRIDETIEEVRAVNAERNTTLRLRKQLDAVLHQAVENEPDLAPSEAEIEEMAQYQVVDSGPFYVNDEVKIVSTQAVGRIISINKRKSVVQIGDFRMTVPLDELMRVKPFVVEEEKPIFIPKSNIREFIASDKVSQTADKLDVRGFRVEQAIHAVEDFMDQLIMGGATQAVILHGKGTGALRMALRMYLRQTFSQISEITDAPDNQGGSGITLCKLNYARMA